MTLTGRAPLLSQATTLYGQSTRPRSAPASRRVAVRRCPERPESWSSGLPSAQEPGGSSPPVPIERRIVCIEPVGQALVCPPAHPFGLRWRAVSPIALTLQPSEDLQRLSLR